MPWPEVDERTARCASLARWSCAWRPILPFWGVIVELELEAPPRHVLEEADIDAAIEPGGGLAEDDNGATVFSLVTEDDRTSLGSTFLPFEPDPRDHQTEHCSGQCENDALGDDETNKT